MSFFDFGMGRGYRECLDFQPLPSADPLMVLALFTVEIRRLPMLPDAGFPAESLQADATAP
ncbi:hypothetical protein [Paenibacillus graminis]|uniref:hypothetical protein n=1 Tax=Paenibacillus graminis TaxID=189425 RepID=UPI002DBCCD15|nr:hypothetical protein [Paenibacillus graminis]MEC0170747.1 hypothetical protein [Paenibacillus graminis]